MYGQLEEGEGVGLAWVYVHSDIYAKHIQCSGVAYING